MADDVTLNAGSGGDVIAADDIGPGVKYQRVKVTLGADGTNDGDVASGNPMPVGDAGGSLTVDNLAQGTVASTAPTVALLMGASDGTNLRAVSCDSGGVLSAKQFADWQTIGEIAHDAAESGGQDKPLLNGAHAVAHGANPTAVAAADRTRLYANRHGILFVIGGHPNAISRSVWISDATGAQTDASMVGTIATGTKVVVTRLTVTADHANTGDVRVTVGFGATSIPAASASGADGRLLDMQGIAPGSGITIGNGAGIIGVGGDGEELRLTCEDPVGGSISVDFTYFTIES